MSRGANLDQWQAGLVTAEESPDRPAWFRTEFDMDHEIRSAVLLASAHGVYQASVNGHDVDEDVLKPGWTAYRQRLLYQVADVSHLVRQGRNAIGVRAARGWYGEEAAWAPPGPFYGPAPAVTAELVVEYADGSTHAIRTDGSWRRSVDGPIRSSGIYAGETYDARRDLAGWSEPGFDDTGWLPVRVSDLDVVPEPAIAAGVRRHETVPVREVITTPSGRLVLDFGQNLVGRLRVRVDGPRGTEITFRHAEVLEDGELGVRPLRGAAATDRLILAGGPLTWEPEFTYHGFRYAEINGWPGEFDPAQVEAVVIHSAMERTGWFESSDPMLNRLHENAVWSMRGNFVSLPTDCPQRDERMGWTGDIQVFAPTATFLFDVNEFLASWLRDLACEQDAAGGVVPYIVPDVLDSGRAPRAAWGDAATVVPWTLYERFGDVATLREQYPSMRAWVEVLIDVSDDDLLWEGHPQYGDWLDPQAPPDDPGAGRTHADLVATAHVIRSLDIVARAADVLGERDDAETYRKLAAQARESFIATYATAAGRLVSDSPTAYAMVVVFGIVTDEQQRTAGERLATLVRSAGYRIATGFVGTPIICDALTITGHLDVAERLLFQTENPSWMYPITMGATTIWERWDSMLPDGTINPGGMTSFNHYALGAVADWLHRVVAGLAPAAPGYRVLRIEPRPLRRLSHAGATLDTRWGRASVRWERDGDEIRVRAQVPTSATAEVLLPGWSEPLLVGAGVHEWTVHDLASPSPPIDGDATPARVVDDDATYQAVLEVLAKHGDAFVQELRTRTQWLDRMSLADEYHRHPEIAQDLRDVLERVGSEQR